MNRIFSLLFLLLISIQSQSQTVIDEVVAVVGKNNIKLSDIENRYTQIRVRQGNEAASVRRCEILEDLLLNKLILHKANIDSITVTTEEVEANVDEELNSRLREFYNGSKENMEKHFNRSYNDIRDQFIDIMKENSLIQQAQQKLTEHVKATPKEVEDYFNSIPKDSIPIIEGEYEFAQIIKTPIINEGERDRVKLELNKLRERILKGENFATLATLYSQDPVSARKGGELGFFSRGEMVREFEVAAFSLKPGDVSPVIETKFGFHIIQLIERRGDIINARHILISPKASPEDLYATKQLLDSISILIKNKTITFDEAIELYSDEPAKKMLINPYTLNARFTDEMAKHFIKNVNYKQMNVGDISPVHLFKDEQEKDAYRVICLTSKIEEHKANLTEDYDKIYNIVLQNNKQKELIKWGNNTIKKSYVWLSDDYKDCDFQLNWIKK